MPKAVMIHGRPENEYCCMEVSRGEEARSRGWRRCHSQMVWQAMVAVMAFAAVAKVPDGHWFGEHPYRTAGWF